MDGLSLVIDDGNGGRHVSQRTRGLRFKRSAYGGDVDLTANLTLPRGFFTDLGPNDPVTVYDGRTGAYVWRGTAHQPGVTVGPRGEVYELQAFGGAARLQAITDSLAYVHALDEDWKRGSNSTRGSKTSEEEKADKTPFFQHAWDKGYDIEGADAAEHINRVFQDAGLVLGRIRAEFDAGVTTADYTMRLLVGTSASALTVVASRDASTVLAQRVATRDADFGAGNDLVALQTVRNGAGGVIPDKARWFRFLGVVARQLLKDKYGANIITGYNSDTVLAHEVIADMVGRGMCPGLDPAKVTIGTFTYAIDALSWLGGIKMGDALEELRVFEPELTWQVYGDEGNFAAWPTEDRYVVSARDGGVSHPGEDGASLADRIFVSWTDRRGRPQTTKVTAAVDVDFEAEPITLPEGVGSTANAVRAGGTALALRNDPPRAGTAVVRRPIMDLWTGALVQPWEIQPGAYVREQETGDRFRLTEVDYSHDDGAAVLTLGEPRKPIEAVIARLERGQRRRRRR